MQTRSAMCLPILLLLGTLAVSAPATFALSVDLQLSDPALTVGETFTIDVVVHDVFPGIAPVEEAVLAFGFDVAISAPSLVSFMGATVAAPFDDDSALLPNTDVAGSVFLGLPNDVLHETFLLATLTFRALDIGGLTLGITSDTTDLSEGLFYLLAGNTDITANLPVTIQANAIPEPGTLVLLASGVLGVLGYRWRRRQRDANPGWQP